MQNDEARAQRAETGGHAQGDQSSGERFRSCAVRGRRLVREEIEHDHEKHEGAGEGKDVHEGNAPFKEGQTEAILTHLSEEARPGDLVAILSNGGFDGLHSRLLTALKTHEEAYAEALEKHIGRHVAPFLDSA